METTALIFIRDGRKKFANEQKGFQFEGKVIPCLSGEEESAMFFPFSFNLFFHSIQYIEQRYRHKRISSGGGKSRNVFRA